MNYFYLFVFICFTGFSFSQANTNNTEQNQTNPNKIQEISIQNGVTSDTTYIETKTMELRFEQKNLKKNKVEKQKTLERTTKNLEDNKKESDYLEGESKAENTKELKSQQLGYSFFQSKSAASTQTTQRSPSIEQQTTMQNVVNDYKQNSPKSFEYHYFKYIAGNFNVDLIADLLEAQKLKPNNVDVQVQLAAYHFIKNDNSKLKENLEFLYKTKKIESEMLTYAEHLLESVGTGGILLTHGFDDTYSALYVQKNLNKRTDVQIISLDFMQSDYYKNSLGTRGLSIPNALVVDVNFFKSFCEANASKNLHISMTFPKPYLKEVIANLSVLGLTMVYDKNDLTLLEKNEIVYEKINKSNTITSYSSEKTKKLSSNYLPLLLSLKKEFELEGEKNKVSEIDATIEKVKIQSNLKAKSK